MTLPILATGVVGWQVANMASDAVDDYAKAYADMTGGEKQVNEQFKDRVREMLEATNKADYNERIADGPAGELFGKIRGMDFERDHSFWDRGLISLMGHAGETAEMSDAAYDAGLHPIEYQAGLAGLSVEDYIDYELERTGAGNVGLFGGKTSDEAVAGTKAAVLKDLAGFHGVSAEEYAKACDDHVKSAMPEGSYGSNVPEDMRDAGIVPVNERFGWSEPEAGANPGPVQAGYGQAPYGGPVPYVGTGGLTGGDQMPVPGMYQPSGQGTYPAGYDGQGYGGPFPQMPGGQFPPMPYPGGGVFGPDMMQGTAADGLGFDGQTPPNVSLPLDVGEDQPEGAETPGKDWQYT